MKFSGFVFSLWYCENCRRVVFVHRRLHVQEARSIFSVEVSGTGIQFVRPTLTTDRPAYINPQHLSYFDPEDGNRMILILIYLLTATGLTPGGSSTVHIYTQTIHRTTHLTILIGRLSGIRIHSSQTKINDELTA
jgi:hypothetical protein